MKIPLFFCSAALTLFSLSCLAAPVELSILPSFNSRPDVENQGPETFKTDWKLTPRGAVLVLDNGLGFGRRFMIEAKTPLPSSEWTLDFVISGRDDFDFWVKSADGKTTSKAIEWREGDLPVHRVRFYYDATKKQLWGWANGTALFNLDEIKIPLTGGVFGWSVTSYGNYGPRAIEISNLVLSEGRPQNAPSPVAPEPLGLAFNGWKTPKNVALSPDVSRVLDKLQKDGETPDTRFYTLAARLVSEAAKPLSPELWSQAQELITPLTAKSSNEELRGATLILALCATRMDVSTREREMPKMRAILETIAPKVWGKNDGAFLARLGLLSPARAIESQNSGDKRVPAHFVEDWISQLALTRPDLGLNAVARLIRQEGGGGNAFAWFLPQLRETSPEIYAAILAINARSPKEARLITSGFDNIRDEMANKAVFRLVSVAPADAAQFFAAIKTPKLRIETAMFLAESGGAFSPSVDAEFEKAIAGFAPSRTENTAATLWIERARYFARFDKKAEAEKFLSQAIEVAGADFAGLGAVYRFLRDQNDARAAIFLDRWRLAAIERDKTSDEFGGGVYLSATWGVVSELVRQKRLDDALLLAQTLDAERLPSNRSNAFSTVAFGWAETDVPRALQIAQNVDEERREGVLVSIAVKVAKTDFARGWALLDRVSPDKKAASVLRFAPYAPADFAPQLRDLLAQNLETRLARPEHLRYGLQDRNIAGLENAPLELLASLESSFAKDRALLARNLFLSIGQSAGLESDPLWQRLKATEVSSGYSTIWAPTYLKDVQSSLKSNEEKGLVFQKTALAGGNW